MFSATASSKVEPLDSCSWNDDAPMTPKLFNDSPPSSPRTPLLSGDVVKPSNSFTALKLGYPFKGSLKKSQQRAYVPPSFEGNESMKASYDGATGSDTVRLEKKRSIKWLDNHGKELTEVKEFEPSECEDSDDEQGYFSDSCACAIQ
eukprot:c10107_g1_i1 orf=402-842(+)